MDELTYELKNEHIVEKLERELARNIRNTSDVTLSETLPEIFQVSNLAYDQLLMDISSDYWFTDLS